MHTQVTAVVPVYGETASALSATLESILRQTAVPQELVIVDDGSEPPVRLKSREPVRLLSLRENVGISAARNQACADALADFLCFVNCNVVLDSRWIENGIAALRGDPRIGVVGGAITLARGGRRRNEWRHRFLEFTPMGTARNVEWLHGHALLVRRSAFVEIGGFDESLRVAHEDVDLGRRLGRAGWTVRYDPRLSAASNEVPTVWTLARKCLRHQGWWLGGGDPPRAFRTVQWRASLLSCLRDTKWHMSENLRAGQLALLPLDLAIGLAEAAQVAAALAHRRQP